MIFEGVRICPGNLGQSQKYFPQMRLHGQLRPTLVFSLNAGPSMMVDRIVPATTPEDIDAIDGRLGVADAAPVVTEPFSQWVVEDRFCAGRPPWEDAGVTFVDDVRPFEEMKLRMLNGSHSTLAYLGYLAGYETVAEAIGDDRIHSLVHDMMTLEVIPTLEMPDEVDLPAYRDALLQRFANPGLKHRTWQIAMDGSQNLPQRLLSTIRNRLAAGQPFDRLAAGVAGWMRYVTGTDLAGKPIDVRDLAAEPVFLSSVTRALVKLNDKDM